MCIFNTHKFIAYIFIIYSFGELLCKPIDSSDRVVIE